MMLGSARRAVCCAWLAAALTALGCSDTASERAQVPNPAPARGVPPASVQFVECAVASGLVFQHTNGASPRKLFPETMAGGAMFWDYNGDGYLDAYLTNGNWLASPDTMVHPTDALFVNQGDGTFRDATQRAGVADTAYTNGCVAGDYDNDGDADLYLANFGPDVLYRNEGDGTFTDQTLGAGLGDPRWGTSCAFFDFDRDGDLDLYIANYVEYNLAKADQAAMPYVQNPSAYKGSAKGYPHPANFAPAPDALMRNEGNGRFVDVTRQAGMAGAAGNGLGVLAADFTGDGWPDVYVANDAEPNFLFLNNGDATFREVGEISGTAYGQDGQREASMGVDAGDYDLDGDLDLTVINFQGEPNELYENEGKGFFSNQTYPSGLGLITLAALGFGTNFLDYDNDMLLDLFVANGHVLDNVELFDQSTSYAQRNFLLHNQGPNAYGNITYEEVGRSSGPGMELVRVGRGTAVGDYDNDGDVDVLVSNLGQQASLLRNDGGNANHWLQARLIGRRSNRDAVGAWVTAQSDSVRQVRQVIAGSSYQSQSDLRLHFGLGTRARVDRLEVRWPSGHVDTYADVAADQLVVLEEGQALRRGVR
jgi:hypothetical protein